MKYGFNTESRKTRRKADGFALRAGIPDYEGRGIHHRGTEHFDGAFLCASAVNTIL